MSVPSDIVSKTTIGSLGTESAAPVGSKEWLDEQTAEVRAHFIRYGCAPRPPRPRIVKVEGPSVIEGREGLSMEAQELFELVQKAGGRADLSSPSFGAVRARARLDDLMRLVAELEHFNLVRHDGPRVDIATEYLNVWLVSDRWRCWS